MVSEMSSVYDAPPARKRGKRALEGEGKAKRKDGKKGEVSDHGSKEKVKVRPPTISFSLLELTGR